MDTRRDYDKLAPSTSVPMPVHARRSPDDRPISGPRPCADSKRTALVVALLAAACATGPQAGKVEGPPRPRPRLIDAGPEAVLAAVREPGARAVVVNVWATWCQPCMKELPELLRLRRAYEDRGVRLILLSGDSPVEREAALEALIALGVDFDTYLKVATERAFIEALDPRWSGALPATFVFDRDGELAEFHEGEIAYDLLTGWVEALLSD